MSVTRKVVTTRTVSCDHAGCTESVTDDREGVVVRDLFAELRRKRWSISGRSKGRDYCPSHRWRAHRP